MKLLKNIFLFGFIPLFLLSFWFLLNLQYVTDPNFTILVKPHSYEELTNWKTSELYKGEKIVGEFVALDENLAIISMRFFNLGRISSDSVIFRIKEKGARSWHYENTYKVDQFQPHKLFPFGFPPIEHSKDKIYLFEVESVRGKKNNAISLSKMGRPYFSKYQIPKSEIFSNPVSFNIFFVKKIVNFFTTFDSFIISLIHLMPSVIYLAFLFAYKLKIINSSHLKNMLIWVFVVLSISNIFLVSESLNIFAIVILIIMWVTIGILYKDLARLSLKAALFVLFITCASLLLGNINVAAESVQWLYIFVVIGFVSLLWNTRKDLRFAK